MQQRSVTGSAWVTPRLLRRRAQGMAMGAQVNIVDSVHIFIAIAAHKGLAAYALGSSVVDSQARPRARAPRLWEAACLKNGTRREVGSTDQAM
jgi:hypothetical protein